MYIPMIGLQNSDQYIKIKGSLDHLKANLPELDFSEMINYIEQRYEKPSLVIEDGGEKKQIG